MGPEQMQQVADLLREGSGELVNYITLCAWFSMVGGAVLLLAGIVAALFVKPAVRKAKKHPHTAWDCYAALLPVGSVLGLFGGSLIICSAIIDLINPVGAAIKMLVQ